MQLEYLAGQWWYHPPRLQPGSLLRSRSPLPVPSLHNFLVDYRSKDLPRLGSQIDPPWFPFECQGRNVTGPSFCAEFPPSQGSRNGFHY